MMEEKMEEERLERIRKECTKEAKIERMKKRRKA